MRSVLQTLLLSGLLLVQACKTDKAAGGLPSEESTLQIVSADESSLPDTLRALYSEDGARLAVRHLLEKGAPLASPEIPPDLSSLYYNGLVHLFNERSLAARDSVVDMYDIHTFPAPVLYQLIVAVDSTAAWTASWKNGEVMTGNLAIDALVTQYDLSLDSYHDWPFYHAAVLEAGRPLLLNALAAEFESIEGILFADLNGAAGDGNDITATVDALSLELSYSVGYGDCPAGCISRHFWDFRIFPDGRVEFVRSYGEPAP